MKVYPFRESLTLPINGKEELQDYLSLYDEKHNLVLRSNPANSEDIISLVWEEIEFVSIPNNPIYMTFTSIMKKFY